MSRRWAGALAIGALAVIPSATGSHGSFNTYDTEWSASGRLITFWNGTRFWMMNADGSARRRLADTPDGSVSLSPDGRFVADLEVVDDVRGELFLTTPAGRILKRFVFLAPGADGFGAPQWAPNKRAIVWDAETARGDEIFVTNLRNRVRSISGRRGPQDAGSTWSPDGRRIAFVAYDNRLTTMALNGRHRRTLVFRRALPRIIDPGPRWAPDGHTIAFAYRRGNNNTRARYSINVVHADGSHLRRVAVTPHVDVLRSLAWSSASDRIAWSDKRGVMSVVVRTGRKRRLTYGNGDSEWVSWAPSNRMLFTAGGHIYTLLPGGRPRRVF